MNAEALDYHFIDTNILVYAHDRSAGEKCDISKELIERLWESRLGCLSIQVLQEFYVNVTRKITRPLDTASARIIVEKLSQWKVHSPRVKDIVQAIDRQKTYRVSFWDAMIIQSAAQLGCRKIWSEDLNPGQDYEGVKVENPFKF